jgi:hypothetical protein
MNQLLSLFLLLLPCLVLAQYPSNGNQKITLGEQTTADGLIWRGVLADTGIITPSSDTSAYIILDTVNHRFYNYNRATNVWSATTIGSISSGLTGVLPVANGGTGNSTNYLTGAIPYSNGTILTSDTSKIFFDNANKRLGIGTSIPTNPITINNNIANDGIEFNYYNNKFSRARFNTFSNSTLHPGNIGSSAGFFFQRWNTNDFNQNDQTAVVNGTSLGIIDFYGNAGTTRGQQPGARISVDVEGGTGTFTGANMRIFTNSSTVSRVNTPQLFISYTGNVGISQSTPTARLHLAAGTATASTAPLKFNSQGASLLNPVEPGAVEFNGTNLLFTPSTTRHTVNHGLPGSATLNFPSTLTMLSADLTITVTGAADGDVVSLGVPNAAVNANTFYSAWVSAANTVTVRFNNYSIGTVDPASALFKVFVTK